MWWGRDLFCILKFPSSFVLSHVTSTGWGLSWGPREGLFHSLFLRSPKVSPVTRWIAQEGEASRRKYGKKCLTHNSFLLIMFIVYFHSSPPTRMKTTIRLRFSPGFFTNVSPVIQSTAWDFTSIQCIFVDLVTQLIKGQEERNTQSAREGDDDSGVRTWRTKLGAYKCRSQV